MHLPNRSNGSWAMVTKFILGFLVMVPAALAQNVTVNTFSTNNYPIAGIDVEVYERDPGQEWPSSPTIYLTTFDDGTDSFYRSPFKEYKLTTSDPQGQMTFGPSEKIILVPDLYQPVTFKLSNGIAIVGDVKNVGGFPVQGILVHGTGSWRDVRSDANGRYIVFFPDNPPGLITLLPSQLGLTFTPAQWFSYFGTSDAAGYNFTALGTATVTDPIVDSPTGGNWTAHTNMTVNWHYSPEPPAGSVAGHSIFVDYGDGTSPVQLVGGLGDIRTHTLVMPTNYSSNASIVVEGLWVDGTKSQGSSPAITIVPNTAVAQPGAGQFYMAADPFAVQWKACNGGACSITSYDVWFSNDGGSNYTLQTQITTPTLGSYSLNVSGPQGDLCRVKVDHNYIDVATGIPHTVSGATGNFTVDDGYLAYRQFNIVPYRASSAMFDLTGNGKQNLIFNAGPTLYIGEFNDWDWLTVFNGISDLLLSCSNCPTLDPIKDFAWADFDNDGDQDVYLGRNGPNYLVVNNGDGTYSYQSDPVLEDAGACKSVSWVDYDSNGDLDVLVCNEFQPNLRLFKNSDGTFAEVSASVGLTGSQGLDKATWADYDGDGDLDLYVASDGQANELYRYDGTAGFSLRNILDGPHLSGSNVDVEWVDADQDGDIDLSLVDQFGDVYLYENQGLSGGDIQFQSSVIYNGIQGGNSIAWADLENDGDLDCLIGGPSTYLVNEGGGVFVQDVHITGELFLNGGAYNSIAHDMDGDGTIDIFLDDVNFNQAIGEADFFEHINTSGNHWLAVELLGVISNRDGIGAMITIQNGSETITRFVNGDGGRFGHSAGKIHVGLGGLTSCVVKVEWPSGKVQNVSVNQVDQTVLIQEPTGGGGPGCPYVYVYDGEAFVQENTILRKVPSSRGGQAEANVTDEYVLTTKLAAKRGTYQIEIREFEQEHSYLDRIELHAVDHPIGSQIALLDNGKIVTHAGRLSAVRAVTSNGMDITDVLSAADGKVFEGEPGDWVDIHYEIPDERQLVVTFHTQEKENQQGPPKTQTGIEVFVKGETTDESQSIGTVQPRELLSPHSLALAERYREGEMVLRLQWHTKHDLDDAGILTEVGSVVPRKEMLVSKVGHSARSATRSSIREADGEYVELFPGEAFRLEFDAIPPKGKERSFLLLVEGHYVHLDRMATGESPKELRLHPGSPQPFNPRTTLRFELPTATHVDLSIYSLSGRLVRTVLDRPMAAGSHEVLWDGTTSNGNQATAGTYFARMRTDLGIQTQKLLLVK